MNLTSLALRNLSRHRRRTLLTGVAILVGTALSTFSYGFGDGTYNEMIDVVTRSFTGHVEIQARGYLDEPELSRSFAGAEAIVDELRSLPGFEAATVRIFGEGLASLQESTASSGVLIVGVEPALESRATHLAGKLREGAMLPDAAAKKILIGTGLARLLGARPGSEVALQVLADDGLPAYDLYTVAGTIEVGDSALDRTICYLHRDDAAELLALGDRVHQIAVVLSRLGAVDSFVEHARRTLEARGLEVLPWHEVVPELASAIAADKIGMHAMIFIIVLVVAIVTLNTILMSVLERTHEFGILRAIGTRPGQIARLIGLETLLLCGLSAAAGVGLGTLANLALARVGIPLGSYSFEFGGAMLQVMRTTVSLRSILIPSLAVLGTGLLVAIPPAVRAARIVPAAALRK